MAKIPRRKIFRAIVGLGLLLMIGLVLEMSYYRAYVNQMKNQVHMLTEFNQRFSAEAIKQTCPKEKFQSHYQCFRDVGRPFTSEPLDVTSALMVLGTGVNAIIDDKENLRCNPLQCITDDLEMTLDIQEQVLKKRKPSQWSLIWIDHIDRLAQVTYASLLLWQLDRLKNSPEAITSTGSTSDRKRFRAVTGRYDRMRPLIEEQAKEKWMDRFLRRHFYGRDA